MLPKFREINGVSRRYKKIFTTYNDAVRVKCILKMQLKSVIMSVKLNIFDLSEDAFV